MAASANQKGLQSMGMYDHFRRKFAKDYELLVNTDLSPDIRIGTVGQLRFGKKFVEEGLPDLRELGLIDLPVTAIGPSFDKYFKHTGDSESTFRIKAAGDPPTEALGQASAGFSASFSKQWSYLVAVKGMRYQALDLTPAFRSKLHELAETGALRPSMEFVIGVYSVESVSWVLSLQRESKIEVAASVEIASMADLGVDWTTKLGSGSTEYMRPQGTGSGRIPLFFKLGRMRRNGQIGHVEAFGGAPLVAYASDDYVYELVRPSELLGDDDG